MKIKKIFAMTVSMALCIVMCTGCGSTGGGTAENAGGNDNPAAEAPASSTEGGSSEGGTSDGSLIKVGIINNDPNESGYRTANDKDLKEAFSKENGYDSDFYYSLKNDEQIADRS